MQYAVSKVILLISALFLIHSTLGVLQSSSSLHIIVTYPYLYDDVKSIVCPDDVVVNLAKPGVDPHEYYLTPSDIDVIRRADIVISTAHTHIELEIKELIEKGEVKAILIEIPHLEGMKIFKNPSTGTENYHEILLYPENYIAFMNHLKRILIELRPQCREVYEENVAQFILRIQKIINATPKLNRVAVLDTPIIQYIAVWLGLNVSRILLIEEEIPITPKDVEEVEEVLKNRIDSIAVVANGSKASRYLIELASEHGRKVLVIPNPISSTSILSLLENIVMYVNDFTANEKIHTTTTPLLAQLDVYRVVLIAVIAVVVVVILLMFKLGRW